MKTELHRLGAIWRLLASDTHLSEFVTDYDISLFSRRAQAEGMVFLTVTLPNLGKALDQSFRTGVFECPSGWSGRGDRVYPRFLERCWDVLFDSNGKGRWLVTNDPLDCIPAMLLPEDMGPAVHCLRQLTYAFYKYELPWSSDQAAATIQAFKDAEDELWSCTRGLLSGGLSDTLIDGKPLKSYLDFAERLIQRVLGATDPYQIKPKYGTGATACKSTPWGRWGEPRFIPKLDEVYPYSDWFFSGLQGLDQALSCSRLEFASTVESPSARVVLVPKDARGPRLISAEPREYMYIQQGLFEAIVHATERYPNVRQQVSIIDQERNRYLALLGSQTNNLATLDLKEASDRVSWWLVTRLFPSNWVRALGACRSEETILPDGTEVPFTKFAPMGSACCFPVEALVFWALVNAAISDDYEKRYKALFDRRPIHPYHPGLTNRGLNDVSVFGDDIIIQPRYCGRVIELLEAVGLKVNRHKSYVAGPFRESCGVDAFAGYDVTPVRVKHRLASDGINVVYRFNTLCNSILLKYGADQPQLARKCRSLTESFFGIRPAIFPVKEGCGCPGYFLADYYWNICEGGQTPVPLLKKKRPRVTAGGRVEKSPCTGKDKAGWAIANVRRRKEQLDRRKPNYCCLEARVLTEKAVEAFRDLGWSSVLRSFLTKEEWGGANIYAFRKRVRHELAWVRL